MPRGVRIGLRDVHYALLNEDVAGISADYAAPVHVIGAITSNINPNSSTETLFADDGPMETATTLGDIELELVMADLPLSTQRVWLGHGALVNGKMVRKAGDVPPWIALGFKALKSNGGYRWVWLPKGKFMIPEEGHETRGDSIEYQTPTINGAFVKRDYDDAYMIMGDDDEDDFDGSDWFTASKLEE